MCIARYTAAQSTDQASERARGRGGEEAGAREVEKREGKNAKEVRRARV